MIALWTGDVDNSLARLFGAKWWYVMGQHTQMFSRSSLKRLMEEAAFELAHRANYPYVINLGYLGHRLGHYPVIGPMSGPLLNLPFLSKLTFSLVLPTEIFDIYRKIKRRSAARSSTELKRRIRRALLSDVPGATVAIAFSISPDRDWP